MLGLALASKEDIALLLPTWGFVSYLQVRPLRLSLAIALTGVVYFVATNAVVLPLLRGTPIGEMNFWGLSSPLGNSLRDIVEAATSRPDEVATVIFSKKSILYWYGILSSLLFLPLLGFEYCFVPLFLFLEIAIMPNVQDRYHSYIFPALPFIFAAAMRGCMRLAKLTQTLAHRFAPGLVPAHLVRHITLALLVFGLAINAYSDTTLMKLLVERWPAVHGLRDRSPLFRVLSTIPREYSVAASRSLVAQTSARKELYWIGGDGELQSWVEQGVEFISVDANDFADDVQVLTRLGHLLCASPYGVVYSEVRSRYPRIVLRRGAPMSDNAASYRGLFPNNKDCP